MINKIKVFARVQTFQPVNLKFSKPGSCRFSCFKKLQTLVYTNRFKAISLLVKSVSSSISVL